LANIYPPKVTNPFFADANGDTSVSGLDSTQWNMYILNRTYTTDTLQPQNAQQKWNTCDVNGDALCTSADVTLINKMLLNQAFVLGDTPWTLTTTVPLAGNPIGTWIPFQNNLLASTGNGIAGIVIETTIISGSGELSGRECNPVAGTRDQLTVPGAQCALGVTVTNLVTTPMQGLTETGTYGMQLKGNGGDIGLQLKVYPVTIPHDLGIPATTTLVTVSFPLTGEVNITAEVAPSLTLTLTSTACDLGSFDSANLKTCSYGAEVSTNGYAGYTALIKADGNLRNATNSIANVLGVSVTPATESYGLATTKSSQTISQINDANSDTYYTQADCTALDNQGSTAMTASALTTSDQTFASSSGPVASDTTYLCHAVAITGTTPAGVYAQLVIITAIGNF